MSTDLLDGGRPKRLILRKGHWYLEMTRLVSSGDGVFQPRNTRIEGRAAILEALRRSKNGKALVDGAQKIVSAPNTGEDVSFDAIDGRWIPSRLAPSYIQQLDQRAERTPVEAALIADLTMLRASHEGLMARVARLERLLAHQFGDEIPAFSARPARAHERTPFAATLDQGAASGGAEPAREPAGGLPGDGQGEGPGGAVAPEPRVGDAPGTKGAIEFPALGLVTDALTQLCGHEIPLKEMAAAPSSWLESPGRFYASWFSDEAGDVLGGFLCDSQAAARLGGAYLAMSQADIEAQAAAAAPEDDVLSATSDICTTLSGLVNDVRGNPQIRSTPLVPFQSEPPLWIDSPSARLVYVHPGGGVVAFLAR